MSDKIDVTCSGCGEATTIPEYTESGIPHSHSICGDCGEYTELNPRKLNSGAWEWAWMMLFEKMEMKFENSVTEYMREYIIGRRNFYIKELKHPLEDALEPQSSEQKANENG